MGKRDPRVDDYIARAPEFARSILTHLRDVVHEACPDVEETMKWSRPSFVHHGILCVISAFKEHCAFGFWKGSLIVVPGGDVEKAMGQFGRITKVSDLPSRKVLSGYVKQAVKLNEEGARTPSAAKPKTPREVVVPAELTNALAGDEKARDYFEKLSPSCKREYIEWITEAKTEATRNRRLETTMQWLAEGKQRNWKYMNC